PAGTLAVAGATRLKALRSVTFYEHDQGWNPDAQLRAFVSACRLPALDALECDSKASPDTVRALLGAPVAGQLRRLSLQRVGGEGLRLLAGSPALTRLEDLTIRHESEHTDAAALASAGFAGRLTSLELYGMKLGDAGAAALAKMP